MIKELDLNKCHDRAIIDAVDFDTVSPFSWRRATNGYVRSFIWSKNTKSSKWVSLHRFILGITDKKIFVDHINGNILDNRKSNLRVCSHSQNMFNQGLSKSNKTGFKGVSKNTSGKPFRARIKINGKDKQIGTFFTAKEAAMAIDAVAKETRGEFAWLNFPKKVA